MDITSEQKTQGPLPVLKLTNLIKRRSQGGVDFELRIPSFTLPCGEFCAIVGDSGCGKSTLLDILSLVSRPTDCSEFQLYKNPNAENSQSINIWNLWKNEEEQSLAAIRQSYLGYVLQTGGLLPFLTVMQNIQLRSKINGERKSPQEISDMASEMGVGEFLGKKPEFLSGGQRQRVAILRALIHQPRVVFLDEPTASVDKDNAKTIIQKLQYLTKEKNTTVAMVTHDQELVAKIAQKTFVFEVTKETEKSSYSTCFEKENRG